MRIKCPYSDIDLELPDRTDMKFTCPACHKIHRVTISITTPGEDAPPLSPNTRSMLRGQPNIPKKYATGAFAPVVDIPIDANFVLLDGRKGEQPGIDFGNITAAPAGWSNPELSSRQTELLERADDAGTEPVRKTAEADAGPKAAGGSPLPGQNEDAGEAPADSRRYKDGIAVPPESGDFALKPAGEPASEKGDARKYRAGWIIPPVLLLLAAAFFGWQQYRYAENRRSLDSHLAQADRLAWNESDIPAAAAEARAAAADFRLESDFFTVGNLWNLLASWQGSLPVLPTDRDIVKERIDGYLERERILDAFRSGLDPSSPAETARSLGKALAGNRFGNDDPLAGALERLAAGELLARMRREAEKVAPEQAGELADSALADLSPALSDATQADFSREISGFKAEQDRRLLEIAREEAALIAASAGRGDSASLDRYRQLEERLDAIIGKAEPSRLILELADEGDRAALEQLSNLSRLIARATARARSALSRPEESDPELDGLRRQAEAWDRPHPALAGAAAERILAAAGEAEDLYDLRSRLFDRLQADLRRERRSAAVRLAWSMLRIGFADPDVEMEPASFRQEARQVAMRFRFRGLPVFMEMKEGDFEQVVRAEVAGYAFSAGWSPLFHKPVSWMADLAGAMRQAGIPAGIGVWDILEGPGAPLALLHPVPAASDAAAASLSPAAERQAFFAGKLCRVEEFPRSDNAGEEFDAFIQAARRLHGGVMGDESITRELRQALKPVLMGAYERPDPRDYFDSQFCRRLLEANYVENFVKNLTAERRDELSAYRIALGRLEAGRDAFAIDLNQGERVVAVERLDLDLGGDSRSGDKDPETGEILPRYVWRWEKEEKTVFYSPLPSRFVYAFMLAEQYDGKCAARPPGRPAATEVWHAEKGKVASYAAGADRAEGDPELWNQAIASDLSGRADPAMGPPGWNFPLHVVVRDDQGDPLALATLSGVVRSPDFSALDDAGDRRRAEDAWMVSAARTLAEPGELGLIFHQFFRYCSDSPLPELPNLIGSHFGLSDTHQTVYQTLERRWVGRLIGDCDDLAEFFQILTRLQGKLSHVMQLPSHAACGYVDKPGPDQYRFVVLQTGPVVQFNADSLNDVVEAAYRSFDRDDGLSHMTTDAVPLLLRFANEETRTPFVLSARIYEDAEYADAMIRVQSYWHEHVYSAAIREMEAMLETDQEIGNIKELGSLYERVGEYGKSARLREMELEKVRGNPQAELSTLLELAELGVQEKNREKALAALAEMESLMRDMIRRDDAQEFFRAMTFRSLWAMHLARLGQASRAWNLVQYDAGMTKRQLGRLPDPVIRTMVTIYENMRRPSGGTASVSDEAAAQEIRRELDEAFGRGYFKKDDSYNAVIARNYFLGRYAVAALGRKEGLERLASDGPYPDSPRDHAKRGRGIDDGDWEWFRITPQLYLALGLEMLDRDDFPELYDPAGAKIMLERVGRAARRGTGLGSDVSGGDDVVKAEITLAFLNRDIDAFRRNMAVVKEKNYASLYDDAALTFGLQCGLIPTDGFPDWIKAFREFFPGEQHYFKVVYRAIDKENYDHALMMAEATPGFFPGEQLLREEAEFVRKLIPVLKRQKPER
ncbi:MAG: hypothetical protein LBE84_09680 [Planctomycetota bacterium]|jgi:hypothetical protein|nr:hypothetical protein [Planctomycetota bacterium]